MACPFTTHLRLLIMGVTILYACAQSADTFDEADDYAQGKLPETEDQGKQESVARGWRVQTRIPQTGGVDAKTVLSQGGSIQTKVDQSGGNGTKTEVIAIGEVVAEPPESVLHLLDLLNLQISSSPCSSL
ncbi:hypothetical protein GCK32_016828 [Trichostrongylus colubriformis]|uniref:Uncharacterized protein n=1 Tax=Trichostrongylus colubriformis TaxID=6319 RepID=A0AAN8G924_TRICO